MKRTIILLCSSLFALLLLTCALGATNAQININPGQIFVGTQITCSLQLQGNQSTPPGLSWNFGDGSAVRSTASPTYFYKRRGQFTITCNWAGSNVTKPINVGDNRSVSYAPGPYYANKEIQFRARQFTNNNLKWSFQSGPAISGGRNITHNFTNPGTYRVKVFYDFEDPATAPINTSITIVPDTRTLESLPTAPRAGQAVTFAVRNFGPSPIKWRFGDGSNETSGATTHHIYTNPGSYRVKAFQGSDNQGAKELSLQVAPDNRRVTITPNRQVLYRELTFTPVNFPGGSLDWDFGDNEKITATGPVSHVYNRLGNFKVIAKLRGSRNLPIETTVNIDRDIRQINVSPQSPQLGMETTIKLLEANATRMNWRIGNFDTFNGATGELKYRFIDPGSYPIVCSIEGQTPVTANVVVRENRSITASLADVFVGSRVTFTTRNTNSSSLKWDFGGGPLVNGGAKQEHVFPRPGNYTVKVFDFDGKARVPISLRVNVLRENRNLEPGTKFAYQDTPIEIRAKNFKSNSIQWNLPDGSQRQGGPVIQHRFRTPGNFTITAVDFAGKDGKAISLDIRVEKDLRELKSPPNMIAGEGYELALQNAGTENLEWQFPSGQKAMGPRLRGQVFASPGPQQVTINDPSGAYPPFTGQVMIKQDMRRIESANAFALPEEEVTVIAYDFVGPGINWVFGDGQAKPNGPSKVKHTFQKPGNYKVTAVDMAGKSRKTFSLPLKVVELTPGFDITQFEITFSDGKYYKVVPIKSYPPAIQVRIKANGRGILRGKWLLDKKTLGLFSVQLEDKKTTTLKGNNVVKIPVNETGMHLLKVEFTNFQTERELSELRYFVTTSGAIEILHPRPGVKIKTKPAVTLKWSEKKRSGTYELAISQKPFQFLRQDQIQWQKVGKKGTFSFPLPAGKSKSWFYWQVREVDTSKRVVTTSEMGSFKII